MGQSRGCVPGVVDDGEQMEPALSLKGTRETRVKTKQKTLAKLNGGGVTALRTYVCVDGGTTALNPQSKLDQLHAFQGHGPWGGELELTAFSQSIGLASLYGVQYPVQPRDRGVSGSPDKKYCSIPGAFFFKIAFKMFKCNF